MSVFLSKSWMRSQNISLDCGSSYVMLAISRIPPCFLPTVLPRFALCPLHTPKFNSRLSAISGLALYHEPSGEGFEEKGEISTRFRSKLINEREGDEEEVECVYKHKQDRRMIMGSDAEFTRERQELTMDDGSVQPKFRVGKNPNRKWKKTENVQLKDGIAMGSIHQRKNQSGHEEGCLDDEMFMREALSEAGKAAKVGEVPVGAVLVHRGSVIARSHNRVEVDGDPTAHAEMLCIRRGAGKLGSWRLLDATLYVTLEPCPMCAGAILQARVGQIVWGAPNSLLGADGSWINLFPDSSAYGELERAPVDSSPSNGGTQPSARYPVHPFHRNIEVRRGVLAAECSAMMRVFFQMRRRKSKEGDVNKVFVSKKHQLWTIFPRWSMYYMILRQLNVLRRWWN